MAAADCTQDRREPRRAPRPRRALHETDARSSGPTGRIPRGSCEVTIAEATLAGLRPALPASQATCNRVWTRPALGYLTPAGYPASVGVDV